MWGQARIDSDQMGVPTRCNAVTEIAPRCLAAFLENTLCILWQRVKIYEFLMRGTSNPLPELDENQMLRSTDIKGGGFSLDTL